MRNFSVLILVLSLNFISLNSYLYAQHTFKTIEAIEGKEVASVVHETIDEVVKKVALEYTAENLRDPFQKKFILQDLESNGTSGELDEPSEETSAADADAVQAMKLQGLITGGIISQAIINDSVVKVGDTINNMKIININKDGVSVLLNNQVYSLSSPASVNLNDSKKGLKGGQK